MAFPLHRARRLRRTETMRRMVRETRLSPDNLIAPLFVVWFGFGLFPKVLLTFLLWAPTEVLWWQPAQTTGPDGSPASAVLRWQAVQLSW